MTSLAFQGADILSPAGRVLQTMERATGLVGGIALLPGLLLGAVMFIVQSL